MRFDTALNYYLWGALKDKCYVDKPEIIDALKDNIREVIGEILETYWEARSIILAEELL